MAFAWPRDPGVSQLTTATVDGQRSIWENLISTISNTVLTGIALFRTPKQNFVNPPLTGGGGSSSGAAAPPPSGGFFDSIGTTGLVVIGAGFLGVILIAMSARRR